MPEFGLSEWQTSRDVVPERVEKGRGRRKGKENRASPSSTKMAILPRKGKASLEERPGKTAYPAPVNTKHNGGKKRRQRTGRRRLSSGNVLY